MVTYCSWPLRPWRTPAAETKAGSTPTPRRSRRASSGELARLGHDVSEQKADLQRRDGRPRPQPGAARRPGEAGINPQLKRVNGKTLKQLAAEQAVNGFTVPAVSYDEPGGIRDQVCHRGQQPQVAKLVKLGTTTNVARSSRQAHARCTGQADGSRPAVLYSSTQHAREWISTEVNRRLMNWYVDQWRANDRDVRNLLEGTELWFMPVANPDGTSTPSAPSGCGGRTCATTTATA